MSLTTDVVEKACVQGRVHRQPELKCSYVDVDADVSTSCVSAVKATSSAMKPHVLRDSAISESAVETSAALVKKNVSFVLLNRHFVARQFCLPGISPNASNKRLNSIGVTVGTR